MILDKIIASTRARVKRSKELLPPAELLKRLDAAENYTAGLRKSLVSPNGRDADNEYRLSIIAEIKKASPSKGLIRADFDHMKIASEYAECDVQALSVLTEPEFFKGDIKFISDIKAGFDIPVLRKDFIVDEYQIYEAKLYRADAILLIMAALSDKDYKRFSKLAMELGLDALVETHNEEEVKRAVEYGGIIGVNNRDLSTFKEDITTCERLLPFIPNNKVKVAESAVRSHGDFEYLSSLKFDAALIGEAFMRENDIQKAVDNLRYGN